MDLEALEKEAFQVEQAPYPQSQQYFHENSCLIKSSQILFMYIRIYINLVFLLSTEQPMIII